MRKLILLATALTLGFLACATEVNVAADGACGSCPLTLENRASLSGLAVGDTLDFSLAAEDKRFSLAITGCETMGPVTAYRAAIGGVECATVLKGASGWTIELTDVQGGKFYRVREENGAWIAREFDPNAGAVTPCEPVYPTIPQTPVRRAALASAATETASTGPVYVDVLIAFEGGAKTWVESQGMTLEEFAAGQIGKSNGVLKNTELDGLFQFRYGGVVCITNVCSDITAALNNETTGTGGWELIREAREKYGADVVSLMIDTGSQYGNTGLSWGLGRGVDPVTYGYRAYSAVSVRAATITYTTLHEIGHLLGCDHSEAQTTGGTASGWKEYSHGYYFKGADDGKNYFTIMAYNQNNGVTYTQAPYFSSPDYKYQGTAVGTALTNDNNRTIRETYAAASAWMVRQQSEFGPTAVWTNIVDGASAGDAYLSVVEGQVNLITGLTSASEKNGQELTVVLDLKAMNTGSAVKLFRAARMDPEGKEDEVADAVGLDIDATGAVTGLVDGETISLGVSGLSLMDGMHHKLALSFANTKSSDGEHTLGSQGWYGLRIALDGKVLGTDTQVFLDMGKHYAVMSMLTFPESVLQGLTYYTGTISDERLSAATAIDEVREPLMSEAWDQHGAFNAFTPVVNGSRAPCGCVATAMGQMFHHYAWPRYTYRLVEGATTYGSNQAEMNLAIDGRSPFGYAAMSNTTSPSELPDCYETSRFMLFVDALSRMWFDGGSGNTDYHYTPEYASYWYEKGYEISTKDLTTLTTNLVTELQAGHPVQLTINGHQVVIDGYRIVSGVYQYHINFGWANYQTSWYTITFNSNDNCFYIHPVSIGGDSFLVTGFWAGMAPKKTVQMEPLPLVSTNELTLAWHLPDLYAQEVTGFTLTDTTLATTHSDISDATEVSIPFDRAGYYPIGTIYGIDEKSTFSVMVASYYTTEISMVLEGRVNGGAWQTLADVALSTQEDVYEGKGSDKGTLVPGRLETTLTPDLSSFVGQAMEFRLKTIRGQNSADRGSAGEYIKLTAWSLGDVFTPKTTTIPGDAASRRITLSNLATGYHRFAVTPNFATAAGAGIEGEAMTTRVADTAPTAPAITRLETMANPMANELVRYVKPGGIVFFVKGNAAVTNITAKCSHRSYIETAEKSTKLTNGWYAITCATPASLASNSQMIYTLDAEDRYGNHALRDVVLSISGDATGDEENYLIGKIDSSVLYVPEGITNVLDAALARRIVGKGTVVFNDVAPVNLEESALATAFGFNDSITWQGTVILNDITETAQYNYELKNENSKLVYTKGLVVPDPEEEDPEPEEDEPDPTPTPTPGPSTAAKLELNFYTPSNNWLGVEYILGDTVWTNEMAVVSGVNYWRVANNTSLSGSGGASTLVYKTPDKAGQSLLAGGKGLNPNAQLYTSNQYWQVAVPLNLPSGVTYTFQSVLPEIITLNVSNSVQPSHNTLTFSAEVSVAHCGVTNTTGRIGPSSVLNGTTVNAVTGSMASGVTVSDENMLLLKMWHDAQDSSLSQVYTAALGVELYLYEGPVVAEGSGEVTDLGDGSYAVPPSVTKITGISADKVVVKYGTYVITGAFSVTGDATSGVTIALSSDTNAVVKVDDEEVSLVPEIDHEHDDTDIAAGGMAVKSIPGLTYTLVRDNALVKIALSDGEAEDVKSEVAKEARTTLKDPAPPADKAFYRIRVTQ